MPRETQPLLDLAGYQTALLVPPLPFSTRSEYLVTSIVGEVGKLFYPQAPSVRVAVYGDLAARVALLLHGRGVTQLLPVYPARFRGDVRVALLHAVTNLYRVHAESPHVLVPGVGDWVGDAAEDLWRVIRSGSDAVAGTDFQDVLRTNLQSYGAQR